MAVTSLSDVTISLETLLKENIEHRLSNIVTVATSAVSPLDVSAGSHLVNVFLFHFHPEGKQHIHENQAINPPLPASFSKPITLYYHLTAHHNSTTGAHLVEQDLLGHALATLLDYTELDDALSVGGMQVLGAALQDDGNAFELEVLSKSDTEALNVWAGHEGAAIRPSLYFKVKNVRLKPEMPLSFAGPILSIGHLVVPNMGPRIASVHSTITATLPMETGPVDHQFKRSPAELYLGAGPDALRLLLKGTSIDPFVGVDLSVPTAAGPETIRVDFSANAVRGWAISAIQSGVAIDWNSAIERPVAGVPTLLQLEPGSAQIRLAKTEHIERGTERVAVEVPSNPVTITLHPHIGSVVPMVPRQFRITLDGGYDLTTMAPAVDHASFIRLAVGGTVYEVIDAVAGLTAGQCAISGTRSLDFVLSATADDTALAFLQLWIRDASSQPFWIGA